ncbi:MAG: NAD+ synthase [Deltaproteobacteria bacterium]|nr:NAD+ synthase [Deltaproteobacteria bacterium]
METETQRGSGLQISSAEFAAATLPQRADPNIEVGTSVAARQVSESLLAAGREYRVAIAQIKSRPGHIDENTNKIIEYIAEAKKRGAQLVVFPELAIPGYCSMDLFFNKNYIADNLVALQRVRAASEGISVIVGFVDTIPGATRPGGRPVLYNSAAIIRDGKLIDVQDKTLLPNYEIFFEDRYFMPARERKVVDLGGIKVGSEICEDLWASGYGVDPTEELVKKGADLVVNLSASPFDLGKFPVRSGLVQGTAKNHSVPLVYANLVGGYDGYEGEVIFDGRSMVVGPDGRLAGMAKSFNEDLIIVDIAHPKPIALPEVPEVEELYDSLVLGIRDYFERINATMRRPFNYAVIGLSGGIDSAIVAALATEALGKDRVLGITLPSRYNSSATVSDAEQLAINLGIKFKSISIERQVSACEETLRSDPEFAGLPEDTAEENIQSRLRMLDLMYAANKLHGIVLNTGNKTELALDNCTIYGDMVGGVGVLADVDKDRIYELAEYINRRAGRDLIPVTTITRPPSAELKPNQTDDMVMGAAPQVIAPMMRSIVEENLSVTQALERFDGQFSPDLVRSSFQKLDRSEWKRRQAAQGFRVTKHAFGQGRRVPLSHGYTK